MAEWILTSSLLIVIVLAVRALFRGRMGLRLRYALWLLVLLRLLVPGTVFQTGLSVLNYVPLPQTAAVQAQPSQSGGSPSAPEAEPMPVRPEGEAEPRPSGPAAAPDSAPAGAADWRGVLTAVWLGGAGVLATCAFICACGGCGGPTPFRGWPYRSTWPAGCPPPACTASRGPRSI